MGTYDYNSSSSIHPSEFEGGSRWEGSLQIPIIFGIAPRAYVPYVAQCNAAHCSTYVACSSNSNCACFAIATGGGICADGSISCAAFTACDGNQTCSNSTTTTSVAASSRITTALERKSTTPTKNSLPAQCFNYTTIRDTTRSVNYTGTAVCDIEVFNSTPIWVRFLGNGGTKIPTSAPNITHCGTDAPGWLNGVYPSINGSTYSAQVCYYYSTNTCFWSNLVQITNCYSFFVFQLIAPPQCNLRYCTIT
ncbi:unnamed protein product [Didymodactylos carnosus]|uniref:UMOD/GP2/OIT3-like D8C domain-containing protein n=1 Tax=Didymodactylos carnosus TaxID=1234261 RepID=A0A814C8B2_9BILA|nr:unnamed protein product [Didymodactylos carnosus]CAF0936662.1 unnamed protein product [Didymodactylos carnosus]CAF3602873.1 unnamed protein product [Didymodactylos carnosus]CAF3713749.1 unnamed protein product [Didymodactylos carnosus]